MKNYESLTKYYIMRVEDLDAMFLEMEKENEKLKERIAVLKEEVNSLKGQKAYLVKKNK